MESKKFNITGSTKIEVKPGDEFSLVLNGNPTTGYLWMLDNADAVKNSPVQPVNLTEHNTGDNESEPHPHGLVGAPSNSVFKFKVAGSPNQKEVQIKLVYKRPWLSENAKEFIVDLTIA